MGSNKHLMLSKKALGMFKECFFIAGTQSAIAVELID